MKVLPNGGGKFTVLDFGCGYGQLASMLSESGHEFSYTGIDIVPGLIAAGRSRFAGADNITFGSELSPDASFDFVFASGVFNVKLETSNVVWQSYIRETIGDLASRARRGLALNFLGFPSSPGLTQNHLHYQERGTVRAIIEKLGFKKVKELREPSWELAVLAWK
jgi:SAM-dependent methyltransferase